MKILLFLEDEIVSFYLSTQISGSYSFDADKNEESKLINIKERGGKWILYSTEESLILNNNDVIKEIEIELNKYYKIKRYDKTYNIYIKATDENNLTPYKYNKDIDLTIGNKEDNNYFSYVSTVRRDTELFNVSIKDNLKMVSTDFREIRALCKELEIDDEIVSLKKGYNTVIDDNTPISMSVRKLLVIVRMLLNGSKVLLIDDIINFLDAKHEKNLLNFLNKIKKNHTILIITNSKKFIEKADKVLEINTNSVIEK